MLLAWAVAGGAFCPASMAQAPPVPDWTRIGDAELADGWLRSGNAAGLVTFGYGRLSEVSLSATGKNGGLKNYYDSDYCFSIGAEASSYYRLGTRTVVAGAVGYDRFSGKRMSGSYFIDPTQTPFDLVEYTSDHAGDKQLESYRLNGAVGCDLTRRLAAGVRFDYTTANYSKRKDLRHVNSLMDMTVAPGVLFRLGPRLALGANYTYRRRIESLLLKVYGKTDRVYESLLDYGAFFGKREVFGENGYTKENETKPLFDRYHGGSLQIDWRLGRRLTLFSECSFRTRAGYYGRPSPTTVVYTDHDGSELAYTAQLTLDAGRQRHILRLELGQRTVSNRENIYTYQTEEVGRSYILYLGQTDVGSRTRRSASVVYTGEFGRGQGVAAWRATLDGGAGSRRILAVNYPDYRLQTLTWWHFRAAGCRNLVRGRNLWTFGFGGGYSSGSGALCADGSYDSSGQSETLTRTLDDLLVQEYEFLTAPRVGLELDVRLTRRFGSRGIRGFVALDYAWDKAFSTTALGNAMRHTARLQLGCAF